jgi:hypothetical protein
MRLAVMKLVGSNVGWMWALEGKRAQSKMQHQHHHGCIVNNYKFLFAVDEIDEFRIWYFCGLKRSSSVNNGEPSACGLKAPTTGLPG